MKLAAEKDEAGRPYWAAIGGLRDLLERRFVEPLLVNEEAIRSQGRR